MKQSNCPDSTRLQRWLSLDHEGSAALDASTSDARAGHDELARHIDGCRTCQTAVEQLLAESSSEFEVKQPHGGDGPRENAASRVAEAIKHQIRSPNLESVLSPGEVVADYEIVERIGGGVSGHVYRATDQRLSRTVALKVFRQGHSDDGLIRLDREAKAIAALNHEHIVSLFDVHLDVVPKPFLVMEWVEGGTVRQAIRDQGQLECHRAARIAAQIASALAAAHDQGLIHRDLKSTNVLLTSSGDAKLADFGLVRDLESDSNLTRENIVAGTPAYMAPEQIRNAHDVDGRADQYSLGVMLYEMLCGELPYRGVERMVLQQALHDEPRRPRLLNDQIPRDLETICLKCLSKSPGERYRSAQLLHEDLIRFLNGDTIHARPVGAATQAWRWCRRHTALAASLFVTATLLLTLAIGASVAAIQLRSSSLAAQRNAALAARGRDQLQDTLRRLVFDVNDVLDGEEVDLDEAQESLLLVAIEGMRKVAELGENATDESSAASKNRLASVLFRLDRDAEARAYFDEALEETESLLKRGYQSDAILMEKLRSLEGLKRIAEYEERDAEAMTLSQRIVVEIPQRVSVLSTEKTIEADAWIDELGQQFDVEGTLAIIGPLEDGLRDWEPDWNTESGLESVAGAMMLCEELGDDCVINEELAAADRIWARMQTFLTRQSRRHDLNEEARSDLAMWRFDCQIERSWVAYAREDLDVFVELQQTAYSTYDRNGPDPDWESEAGDRGARRLSNIHFEALQLLDALIESHPAFVAQHSDWVLQVAEQDVQDVQTLMSLAEFPERWTSDSFASRTHHAQVLNLLGRDQEAAERAQTIQIELNRLDWNALEKPTRRLLKQIRAIVAELAGDR